MLDPMFVVTLSLLIQDVTGAYDKINPPPITEPYCRQLAREQGWDHYEWTPTSCFTYSVGGMRPARSPRIIITGREIEDAKANAGE